MTLWNSELFSGQSARYLAIADHIQHAIETHQLQPGEKLPTHRKLADLLNVTVGTITRSYREAQRRGLVEAVTGSGTFVINPAASDVGFGDLTPVVGSDIELSLNLPIGNEFAPGLDHTLAGIFSHPERVKRLLGYQQDQGLSHHRHWAVEWLRQRGVSCSMENLFITCGGQHGLTTALIAATQVGDTIASEGLAYPGIKAAASQRSLKLIGLAMDEQGILPDSLLSHCKRANIRALYVCPAIQNPTNASMGLARKKAIIDIARRYGIWLIEDDVNTSYLTTVGKRLVDLAPDITLYINSHSKHVAPGLRTGYLVAPPPLRDAVSTSIRAQCWFAPSLNVEIVQRWLDSHVAQQWLAKQKKQLAQRLKMTKDLIGDYDLHIRPGSFHAWLVLPDPWRAMEFQSRILSQGVKVLPAESFAVGRFPAPEAIRISFSAPETMHSLRLGLTRIKQQLDGGFDDRLTVF